VNTALQCCPEPSGFGPNRRQWLADLGTWALTSRALTSGAQIGGAAGAATIAQAPYNHAAEPTRADLDGLYTARVDRAIVQGLAYLRSRQKDNGAFVTAGWGDNVGVCGLAGISLLSRGVRVGAGADGQMLESLGRFVLENYQDSGYIVSPGKSSHGPMYEHGFATLFLAELYGAAVRLEIRAKLQGAVDLILASQNKQGGWRYEPRPSDADVSVTVCQVMALRAARNAGIAVPAEAMERAIGYVRRCQNPDGGFMYQSTGGDSRFALTAAAVVAMYNAGIYEGPEIDQAIDYLTRSGISKPNVTTYYFYAHYYSVQAFWNRGGQVWEQWYRRLSDQLLGLQNSSGNWTEVNSNHGSEYATAMACIILNMPRTVLPIFQR
jgi:hypothetical protein